MDARSFAFMRTFVRCWLGGACFNTRGMQNVGMTFAMIPGLGAIHKDRAEYRKALKRYARHHQSHPFWLPCLAGIYLNLEKAIASGRMPEKMFPKVKDTMSYTLSALGDSVFAGSLLVFWALATTAMLLAGMHVAPFVLGLTLFAGLQAFRAATFLAGLRHGMQFLDRLRRWDLINWGARLKLANAVLLALVWAQIWPHPLVWWQWVLGVSALILFGRFVRTGLVSRVFAVAAFLAMTEFLPEVRSALTGLLAGLH